MLKLLVFVPCEKVIVSDEGTSSLITTLEVVNVRLSPEQIANIQPDTIIPFKWQVYTLWQRETEEDVGSYEQRVTMILPDGEPSIVNLLMPFSAETHHRNLRQNARIEGFPVPQVAGECRQKLELRKADGQSEWREIAEYPILVRFTDGSEQDK